MLLIENIFLALNGIKSNKSRSALTMLGIIIGISAVIAIMTIGNSMSAGIASGMSGDGADKISVSVREKNEDDMFGDFMGMGFNKKKKAMADKDYLDKERITSLREHFADRISGIGLTENAGDGTVQNSGLYAYVSVVGDNKEQFAADAAKLIAGRAFYDSDYKAGRKVAVVSDYFVSNMYGGDNDKALGQQISVAIENRYYDYTIVGVYEYEESSFNQKSKKDTQTELYIPLKTALKKTHHNDDKYASISVFSSSITDTAKLGEDVKEYLNDTYYRNNDDYEVDTFSMQSILDSVQQTMTMLTMAISLIAGIALLVGGIGVMNIMLVSITERTREIGTRKALGATNASIRTQFIVESIVLCGVGGIIGIILGMVIGALASKAMGYPATPSISSILISVGFSTFIGVFFGYYPANKAAKMNPIDALRYE